MALYRTSIKCGLRSAAHAVHVPIKLSEAERPKQNRWMSKIIHQLHLRAPNILCFHPFTYMLHRPGCLARETKSTTDTASLRTSEKYKVACAKVHFRALRAVNYDVVANAENA